MTAAQGECERDTTPVALAKAESLFAALLNDPLNLLTVQQHTPAPSSCVCQESERSGWWMPCSSYSPLVYACSSAG